MTSPPYWSLRDYGVPATRWPDGAECVLGMEPGVDEYVNHLCDVFDEVRRVLKPSGTVWVNLGDTYSGSWGNYVPQGESRPRRAKLGADKGILHPSRRPPSSLRQPAPRKSLCLIPERFALAMVGRGWILRNRVVWHKPCHLPSSAKDRLTTSWEHLFFFVKSPRYHFDLDAIRTPHSSAPPRRSQASAEWRSSRVPWGRRLPPHTGGPGGRHPKGRNPADCWRAPEADIVSISPLTGRRRANAGRSGPGAGKGAGKAATAHVAAFPERLCERPILAGCPPGGIVLDPFIGSGTTALVAKRLGRRYLGFDLNPDYVALARERLAQIPVHHQQLKGGGVKGKANEEDT